MRRMQQENARAFAPAAARNSGPVIEVLRGVLPVSGQVLEVASGTGQHVVAFAEAFPKVTWQPSDPDPEARSSIAGWIAHRAVGNVRPPLDLDVARSGWEHALAGPFDAVLAINLIHIAPWSACDGLLRGAAKLLACGGLLCLYGPYFRDDAPNAPSNVAFDRMLRSQDPAWSVRCLRTVAQAAEQVGFALGWVADMPANNLSVVFRRA